ncbi:hemagglutinin repeat-containing protein [Helicobacter sp. 11S02629-2]|uniref:two-partner secretion domain-containing protein n=1 Tax=Helicobacter sp. 11S02629-2 TaxID=1476195 RepID=UPI000BA569CD|nr:hemagglutinin repeat-containing protein [Helicobacter sp. 11S02629-2]PAF45296.1 hypothetical protein BKH40_03625 [Helicobacter sp. 11S02629-2]
MKQNKKQKPLQAQKIKQILSVIVSFSAVLPSNLVGADLRVRNNISPRNVNLTKSANDTDVVNIANPKDGISHNNFNSFDINSAVILNNSQANGVSQTGGFVTKNPNLTTNARLIITEVHSANPTSLNGSVEVFGKSADLIFANENGIVVNGASFINANGLTLTTGLIEANRLDIKGSGQVKILEKGIGVSGDYFNIIARGMSLAGSIVPLNPAKRPVINLVAGQNIVSLEDKANPKVIESRSDDKTKPTYAIDGSSLGSMYADRIRFISTEDGVGVRHEGSIKSLHDLEVLAAGNINLKDAVSTEGNLKVDTKGDASLGVAAAVAGKVAIKSKSLSSDELLYAGKGLNVTSDNATIKKAIVASDDFSLNGSDAVIDDTLVAAGNLNAKASKNANFKTVEVSGGNANIASQGDLSLDSIKANSGSITLAGIKVDAKSVAASRDINLKASNLLNSSLYSQDGSISTSSNTATLNTVQAAKDISLESKGNLSAKILLSQEGNVSLKGKDLNLTNTQAKNDITLDSTGTIKSQNLLSQTGGLNIKANSLSNDDLLQASKDITLIATSDLSTKTLISTEGSINAKVASGLLKASEVYGSKDIDLESKSFDAQDILSQKGNVSVNTKSDVNIDTIKAAKNISLNTTSNLSAKILLSQEGNVSLKGKDLSLTNTQAKNDITLDSTGTITGVNILSQEGNLNLKANYLKSTNLLKATKDVSLSVLDALDARSIVSTGGDVALDTKGKANLLLAKAAKNLNITASDISSSYLEANSASLKVANSLTNKGLIQGGTLDINAKSFLNEASFDPSLGLKDIDRAYIKGGSAKFKTDTFNNKGTIDTTSLDLDSTSLANSGTLQATNTLNLNYNSLSNSGDIASQKDITAKGTSTTNTKNILAGSALRLTTDSLTQDGALKASKLDISASKDIANTKDIEASDLRVQASSLTNSGDMKADTLGIKADSITNSKTIKANSILLASTNAITNTGDIESSSLLNLNASTLNNSGNLLSDKNLSLKLSGKGDTLTSIFTNANGKIVAKKDLSLTASPKISLDSSLGKFYSGDSLNITSKSDISLGNYQNEGSINLNTTGDITNANALLASGKSISLSAKNITNSGYIWAQDGLSIKAAQALANNDTLESLGDMSLSAKSIVNKNLVYAHQNLSLESPNITNISTQNGKIVTSALNSFVTGSGEANYGDTAYKTWTGSVILNLPTYSYESNIKQSVIKASKDININLASQDKNATINNILSAIVAGGNLNSVGNLNNETKTTSIGIQSILSSVRTDGGFDLTEHLGSLKTGSSHYFRSGADMLTILKFFATSGIKAHQKQTAWTAIKDAASKNPTLNEYLSLFLGTDYASSKFVPDPSTWNYNAKLVFTPTQGALTASRGNINLVGNNLKNHTDISGIDSNVAYAISSSSVKSLDLNYSTNPLRPSLDSKIFSVNKAFLTPSKDKANQDLSSLGGIESSEMKALLNKPSLTDTSKDLANPALKAGDSNSENTLALVAKVIDKASANSLFNQKVTYYIETNLDYIDMSKFYGSQYFFTQIGFDSKRPVTVIGDAYYEHALLDASLNAQLKNNMTLSAPEVKSLIDNGVKASKTLGLKVGTPLTNAQVSSLKNNLVWYVTTKINGVDVLTPKLYLTKDTLANSTNLSSNLSSIVANKSLKVESDGIDNYYGNLKAKDEVALKADSEFKNISANIESNLVDVVAKKATIGTKLGIDGSGKLTSSNQSNIKGKDISIITDKNLDITNSNITGKDSNSKILLASKAGDINITNDNSLESSFNTKDLAGTKLTTNTLTSNVLSSNISAGNIDVIAKDSLNIKGTNLIGTSEHGAISLEADKLTVSDAKKKVDEFTASYFAGINDATHMLEVSHNTSTHTVASLSEASNIAGLGSINLKANDKLDINASNIEAKKDLNLVAKDINIADSKNLINQNSIDENAQILGYSQEVTKLESTQSIGSSLSAKHLNVLASKDLNVTGSKLSADETSLNAKNIDFKAGVSKTKQEVQSTNFGLVGSVKAGIANASANAAFNTATNENITSASVNTSNEAPNTANVNGTMNSDALATAEVGLELAKQKTTISETKNTLSSIKGNNIAINAKDKADIGGVNIESKNNLSVVAGKLDSTKAVDESSTHTEGFSIYAKQSFHTTSNLASAANQLSTAVQNTESGKQLNAGIVAAQVASNAANMVMGDLANQDSIQSLGFTYNKQDSNTQKEVGGSLKANNSLSLQATKGDLNLNGINLEANNIALKAKDDINIKALKSQSHTVGYSFGAEARLSENAGYGMLDGGHVNVGVGGSVNGSYNKEDSTKYTNSNLSAKNALSLESGKDTTLEGTNTKAKDVSLNIGKDLKVSSLLDKTNSTGFNLNLGGDASLGLSTNTIVIAAASGNVGVGYNQKDASLVNKQSSLVATNTLNGKVSNDINLSGATLSAKNGNINLGGILKHKDLDIYDHSDGALVNLSGGTVGSGNSHNFGADININDHIAKDGKVLSAANVKIDGKDADINHDVINTTTIKDSSFAGGSMNASLSTDMLKGLKDKFKPKPNASNEIDSIALASTLANNLAAKHDTYKDAIKKDEVLLGAPKNPKAPKEEGLESSASLASLATLASDTSTSKKPNALKSAFGKLKNKLTKKNTYSTASFDDSATTSYGSYLTKDETSINYIPEPLERKPLDVQEVALTQGDKEDVIDSIQHISDNLYDLEKLKDLRELLEATTSNKSYKEAFREDYLLTGTTMGEMWDKITPRILTSREDLKGVKAYDEFSNTFFDDAQESLVNNKDWKHYLQSDLKDNKNVEKLGEAILCSYAETCAKHNITFYPPKIKVSGNLNHFEPNENVVYLQENHIRHPRELTITIFHELTHARQDNLNLHPNMNRFNDDMKDIVKILSINQINYVDPKLIGYRFYANQPMEAEAFTDEAKLSRLLDTKYKDLLKEPHVLAQDLADRLTSKADTYKEVTPSFIASSEYQDNTPSIDRTTKPVVTTLPPSLPPRDSVLSAAIQDSTKAPSEGDKKDISDLLKRANTGASSIEKIEDVSSLLKGIANNQIYKNLNTNESETRKEFGKVVASVGKNLENYEGYEGYKNFTGDIAKEVTDKILSNPNFEAKLKADLSKKDNKRELVKVIESEYSKVLQDKGLSGIKAQVVIKDDMKQLGAYSSSGETNVLAISNKDVNPIRLANVALHELTHGRQEVFNKEKDKLPENVLAAHSIYELNSENNNYFSSNYGKDIYINQPVEKEAFVTGDNFERILKDKYPKLSKNLKDDLATTPKSKNALQKLTNALKNKKQDDKGVVKFYDPKGLVDSKEANSSASLESNPLVETLHISYSETPQTPNYAPNDPKDSKPSVDRTTKPVIDIANPPKPLPKDIKIDNEERQSNSDKADIKDVFKRVEGAIKTKDLDVEQVGEIMKGIVNTKSGEIQLEDENLINHAVRQVYLNLWKDKSKNAKDYDALTDKIHNDAYNNYIKGEGNLAKLDKDLSNYNNAKSVVSDVAKAYTEAIKANGIKDSKEPSIKSGGDEDFAFIKDGDDEYINMPKDFDTRYATENKRDGRQKTLLDSAFHEMTHKLQHDLGENQDKFKSEARGWINVLYSNLSMYTYDDRLYKRQPVEDEAHKVGGKIANMVMDALKNPAPKSPASKTIRVVNPDDDFKETLVLKYSEKPQTPNYAPNDPKDSKPSVDRATKPILDVSNPPSIPIKAPLTSTYKTSSVSDSLDTLDFIKRTGNGFDSLSLEQKADLVEGGLLNSQASLNSKKSLFGDMVKLAANKHIFTPFGDMLTSGDGQVAEYKNLLHNVSADAVENLVLHKDIDSVTSKDFRLLDNYKPLLTHMAGAWSDAMRGNGIETTTPLVKNSITADTISFNHVANTLNIPKTYSTDFTFEPNEQKAKDNALESGFHELTHKFQAGVIENRNKLAPEVANVGRILKANGEYYFDGGHEGGDRDANIKRYESQALEQEAYHNATKTLNYYKDVMDTDFGVASMDDLKGSASSDTSSLESEDEKPLTPLSVNRNIKPVLKSTANKTPSTLSDKSTKSNLSTSSGTSFSFDD